MRRASRLPLLLLALLLTAAHAYGQSSTYRLSFDGAAAHSMQVELTLADVPAGPLDVHVSVSSPGRYGPHDFASTIHGVDIVDLAGAPLGVTRPDPRTWRIDAPPTALRVRYTVTSDVTDGTYVSISDRHAHINMPAALLWARGFEDGAMTLHFDLPASSTWQIATQLFPGADAQTFTAPNLAYLMDSPVELSAFTERTFVLDQSGQSILFRLAVHHDPGDAGEIDRLARDAGRLVREAGAVFGELPRFDAGTYTFIADYLPSASPDGMEHRNSTVLTSPLPLRADFASALSALSHEFFHVWNVERIRPRSLEPFDLTRTNESGELWLAEGFTEYYGVLLLTRAGLASQEEFAGEMGALVGQVLASPARRVRTLEQMSRFAPMVDSPAAPRPPNVQQEFLSYYTWGGAVALALDLTLRERSQDRVSLDDFMRALWDRYGRPGGSAPGIVARPYTAADVRTVLASVSGSERFAADFMSRYVQGHQVPDFARLLRRAGMVLRPARGSNGRMEVVLAEDGGRRVTDAQRRVRRAWLDSRSAR